MARIVADIQTYVQITARYNIFQHSTIHVRINICEKVEMARMTREGGGTWGHVFFTINIIYNTLIYNKKILLKYIIKYFYII